MKRRLIYSLIFFFILFLFSTNNAQAYKVPSDPGRLSLIQVEDGQIVNQKDGLSPVLYNYYFNTGRTPLRSSIFLPYNNGIITPVAQGNFNYTQGTVSLWVNTDVWNDNLNHFFFALDAEPRHMFGIWKEVDGSGNSIVRAGIDPDFITIYSSGISSNIWHLLTLTYSPNEHTRFYVDGNLMGTSADVYDGLAYPASTGYCYYYMCWGAHFFYTANAQSTLEDMQTFNYPLTQQQILDIYNSSSPANFYNHVYPEVSNVSFSDNPIIVGKQLTSTAIVTQSGYSGSYAYLWDWGDGTNSVGMPGQHVYTQSGQHTVLLTVTDNEGDSGTATAVITVQTAVEAIQTLVDIVTGFNLQQGINNSLDTKLENAQGALSDANENNNMAAINSLYAFINAVEAQRGNQISAEQADILVAAANSIIAALES